MHRTCHDLHCAPFVFCKFSLRNSSAPSTLECSSKVCEFIIFHLLGLKNACRFIGVPTYCKYEQGIIGRIKQTHELSPTFVELHVMSYDYDVRYVPLLPLYL